MRTTPMIAAGALALAVALPGGAANAQQVVATTDLNLREGPGTRFSVIATIPGDQRLDSVFGCLPDRDWCEVQFRGTRGWVFADYLEVVGAGRIGDVGPRMGLPTARFDGPLARGQQQRQTYEGVQPQADERFIPQRETPGATGAVPQAQWGTGAPFGDDRWRTQRDLYEGTQPRADERFAPQRRW